MKKYFISNKVEIFIYKTCLFICYGLKMHEFHWFRSIFWHARNWIFLLFENKMKITHWSSMKYRLHGVSLWHIHHFLNFFPSILFIDSFNFIGCCKDNVFVLHLINILSESSQVFVNNCKVKIILTKLSMVTYKVTIYDNEDE